jgi:hypothetical protein
VNLGFLVVLHENSGYVGGYLVTNTWGRPLEFRLSSAVQPNRVQQVLYAGTLVPYVCGDLIGKALVERAGVPVQLVVTTCEPALALRLKVEIPVAWLVAADDARARDAATVPLPAGRGVLVCHARHPEDAEVIGKLLEAVDRSVDLAEPLDRVKEAIAEARKMGVTGRSAA